VFDAGPFRVRKCESVVVGFDIRVEVVSEEQKANFVRAQTNREDSLFYMAQARVYSENFWCNSAFVSTVVCP